MSDEVNVTERILDKLEKIDDAVRGTQLEIVEIKSDLREHMARTHAVEKNNELLEQKLDNDKKDSDTRLGSLEDWRKEHKIKVDYSLYLAGGIVAVIEAVIHLKELLHLFK